MAKKITDFSALSTVATDDLVEIVDVSDTTDSANGTNKKITQANLTADAVKTSGDQTVNGVKTFGSFPVTPSSAPTTDYQAANKKYVDDSVTTAFIFETGDIKPTARSTASTGWLMCDGSAVSRTTYADLFAAIGTTYGSGDGSTTFNIPDGRAASLVGAGTSTAFTQNETVALGDLDDDQVQGHYHGVSDPGHTHGTNTRVNASDGGNSYLTAEDGGPGVVTVANAIHSSTTGVTVSAPSADGTNGTPRTGNVTHGKRLGVNFVIKT